MAAGIASVNLCQAPAVTKPQGRLLLLLLKLEAWLDRRASRRVLHSLDDRALADLGLSRADIGRIEDESSWRNLLPTPLARR